MTDQKTVMPDVLIEARALLAVGMDGTIVVLEVNKDNIYLCQDAKECSGSITNVIKFTPDARPERPGLYEFRGFTAPEPDATCGYRFIHRGQCSKIAC
jgi:hypothetical protein